MADTGPCGPCSEIHLDRGEEYCNRKDAPGHSVPGKWGLHPFPGTLEPCFHSIQPGEPNTTGTDCQPAMWIPGMGFERIVSVLQNVRSNYMTDLLYPMMEVVRELTGHSD